MSLVNSIIYFGDTPLISLKEIAGVVAIIAFFAFMIWVHVSYYRQNGPMV